MTDDVSYSDAPRSTGAHGAWRSDERFWQQYRVEETRAEPLTEEEVRALKLQKRNPGPLVPYLQQRLDERNAAELAAREEYAGGRGIKPEDRLDPASIGSMAERGRQERAMNRPQDPNRSMLRPGPRQRRQYSDEPECIDAPAEWRRGR